MKTIYYAGIGPRNTPAYALSIMTDIADQLSPTGWCLRSGHAEGADQAFEAGAKSKQIFLPWEGFNGARSNGNDAAFLEPTNEQIEIAKRHHPNWDACSDGAKLLLCRNVPIILGETLDDPVSCVVTWLPQPDYKGGTRHALNIASTYGVPVFDINNFREFQDFGTFTWDLEKRLGNILDQAA